MSENKPQIAAFCCENSAYLAIKKIDTSSINGIVSALPVPCGGQVDHASILRAFDRGADGVLVLACLGENCQHIWGNTRAEKRTVYVKDMLKQVGYDSERLIYAPIAANDEKKVLTQLQELVEQISSVGSLEGKVNN